MSFIIQWFRFPKCEDLLHFSVLYDCKWYIFGFWTVGWTIPMTWMCHTGLRGIVMGVFHHLYHCRRLKDYSIIQKIISIFLSNENMCSPPQDVMRSETLKLCYCTAHSLNLGEGMRFSSLRPFSFVWFPFLQIRAEHEATLVSWGN